MKAGTVINTWKLGIFESHLNKGDYEYSVAAVPAADLTAILVITEDVNALGKVVKKANDEAALLNSAKRSKAH